MFNEFSIFLELTRVSIFPNMNWLKDLVLNSFLLAKYLFLSCAQCLLDNLVSTEPVWLILAYSFINLPTYNIIMTQSTSPLGSKRLQTIRQPYLINSFGLDYSFNTYLLLTYYVSGSGQLWRQNKQDSVHFFHEGYDDIKQKNFTSIQLHFENTKGDGIPDMSDKQLKLSTKPNLMEWSMKFKCQYLSR